MKASDISLFTTKEQTLLVDTEPKRLAELDEDALGDLLTRVRRTRNKYSDLHRRQGADAVKNSRKRAVTSTANERTTRKAEVMEDAVSRVARYLSLAARSNANELKQERLESASAPSRPEQPSKTGTAPKKRSAKKPATTSGKKASAILPPARKGATSAANKRQQAGRDQRKQ